jgi:hypothetical protein
VRQLADDRQGLLDAVRDGVGERHADAIGVTRSSIRVERSAGDGSPSGAASRTRARTIGQKEEREEHRVAVDPAAPPLRVEHVQQRPEEVAGAVRMLGIGLAQHFGELRAAGRREPELPQQEERSSARGRPSATGRSSSVTRGGADLMISLRWVRIAS